MRVLRVAGVLVGLAIVTGPGSAGSIEGVSLDLHLTRPTYDACAQDGVQDAELTCDVLDAVSTRNDIPVFAWVVVSGIEEGAAGVQFGMCYEPSIIMGPWTVCAGGFEFAQSHWPASGSGDIVTWDECYVPANAEHMTRIGYFQIMPGSVGAVELARDPRSGDAAITDCGGARRALCPDRVGKARANGGTGLVTCGQPGCDPEAAWEVCTLTPTLSSSWSRVKAQFR